MKITLKLCGTASVAVITLATIWNCCVVALALHIWFEPVPPGAVKLDGMDEIWLISTLLNGSIPVFLLTLAAGTVLAARRSASVLALVVVAVLFLASLTPGLVIWQELLRMYEPTIFNLWNDWIWWYPGG